MATWFVLARLFLDTGTQYESYRDVQHPDYLYEGRVVGFGYVDKSIPVPSGLPQIGDCRIKLADTDRKFRDLIVNNTDSTWLRRLIDLRMVQEGASESEFDPFATFEIQDVQFEAGTAEIFGRDTTFAWLDRQIPGLINRTNFPDLIEGIDEAFMPIVGGILDAPSDASPPNPQGVLKLPRMTLTRWGLAQHPIFYVELCGRISQDDDFTFINPADYVITEEATTIDGVDYTLSFVDFNVDQDPGMEVRCRIIEGFYTRGTFDGMPAVENSPLSGLRNPIDVLINVLYAVLQTEPRIPRFDGDSFVIVRNKFNTSFITTVSPAIGYVCDGAIDRPMTVREFLSQLCTSFEMDLYVNRRGEIALNATFDEDPSRPVFSQGPLFGDPADNSLILINSFKQGLANPVCNQLKYSYLLNYATDEFGGKEVYDNDEDQAALAGDQSPPVPAIMGDVVEFRWVRDPDVALDVVRRRMEWLALQSYRVEMQMPLPEVFDDMELAKLIGVTDYWGLAVGGFLNAEVKTTGLTYELDKKLCTVRGVARVPLTPPTVTDVESFIEFIDYGIYQGPGIYARSLTNIPSLDGIDLVHTSFYLEMVGQNLEATPQTWTVYCVDDGASPINTHFLILPGNYAGRSARIPFTPTGTLYAILAPSANANCYRVRMVMRPLAATKGVSELCLSSSSGASSLDQTIGGGDIFRTSSYGLPGDESGFVSVQGPTWTYIAADWATVVAMEFKCVLANASFTPDTKYSECGLWDMDISASAPIVKVSTADLNIFLDPQAFIAGFSKSALTDGHTYEARIRSVKPNAGAGDFNTYFHKARLTIYLNPMRAYEFHNRLGNAAGAPETRSVYAGIGDPAHDVILQVHDTALQSSYIDTYGAVDTGGTGTPIVDSQVTVPSGETVVRSEDLSEILVAEDRLAVGDVLQASLILKYPRTTPPVVPPDARELYYAYLVAQGYPPNRAILFNEGAGTPREYVLNQFAVLAGTPIWGTGIYGAFTNCDQITDWWTVQSLSDAYLSATTQTVLVIRRKQDTTKRNQELFGVSNATGGAVGRRCSSIVPYTDGNVYWDFGGITDNVTRVTYGGYTVTTDVEAWGFRAGAAGMSIWKEGVNVASHANAPTRTNFADYEFVNRGADSGTGDITDIYCIFWIPEEVPDAVMATFTVSNVLVGF